MSDNPEVASIYRVEVWKRIDPRGVWVPGLKETTSAYTDLGAIKSVLETATAKIQLELTQNSEPDKPRAITRYLDSGAQGASG